MGLEVSVGEHLAGLGRGHDLLAGSAPGHGTQTHLVLAEGYEFLASFHVPNFDFLVRANADELGAIGVEGHSHDGSLVPLKARQLSFRV